MDEKPKRRKKPKPEEFAEEMRRIFTSPYDEEVAHVEADRFMCNLLEALGYVEGVAIFRKANKWYA